MQSIIFKLAVYIPNKLGNEKETKKPAKTEKDAEQEMISPAEKGSLK